MSTRFRVACIQTNSTRDYANNLEAIPPLVRAARDQGAELILTPENVSLLEPKSALLREKAEPEATHPALPVLSKLARDISAWLLLGSLAVRADDGRVWNRSILLDDRGEVVARYDKIHLFDVDLGGGEFYKESVTIQPGTQAVVAETPWGRLGMTVCYDLRFPHLYRTLAKAGVDFLSIPAAFTRTTGQAHWHVLQRARAVECGCYVFAPAQTGTHADGRQTFGHSLIVEPWGQVLADAGEDVGVIVADVDTGAVAEARRKVPSLRHDRVFDVPAPQGAGATA